MRAYADDLDTFDAAYFLVGGCGLAVQRYQRSPPNQYTILLDVDALSRAGLDAGVVLRALLNKWLKVGPRSVQWIADEASSDATLHAQENVTA